MKCARQDCPGGDAIVAPVVVLRAPQRYEPAPPLRAVLGLPTCAPCSRVVTLADVVNDDSWRALTASVRAVGRVLPDRTRTELVWIALESDEYRHFEQLRRPH